MKRLTSNSWLCQVRVQRDSSEEKRALRSPVDQERGGGQRSRRASSKRSFVLGLTESQTPTWFNVSECSVPAQSHILHWLICAIVFPFSGILICVRVNLINATDSVLGRGMFLPSESFCMSFMARLNSYCTIFQCCPIYCCGTPNPGPFVHLKLAPWARPAILPLHKTCQPNSILIIQLNCGFNHTLILWCCKFLASVRIW